MAEQTTKDATPQDVEELKIPDVLPLLPIRDVVVYPYMILPLFVGRELSIAAVDQALPKDTVSIPFLLAILLKTPVFAPKSHTVLGFTLLTNSSKSCIFFWNVLEV